jgi:transcriptional regulator with XRE-family HTH domain
MMQDPTFAAAIRAARAGLGWTQTDLGRRIGASAATVCLIEAGKRPLNPGTSEAIQRVLGEAGATIDMLAPERGFVVRLKMPG